MKILAYSREEDYYRRVVKGEALPASIVAVEVLRPDIEGDDTAAPTAGTLAIADGPVGEAEEASALHIVETLSDDDDDDDDAMGDDDILPPPLALESEDNLSGELSSGKFGCFKISVKKAGVYSTYGGFQPTCRFHKKSDATGCKRFFRILGPSIADRTSAMRLAAWWCVRHSEFTRQRFHLNCPMYIDECPSSAWLLANKVTVPPGPHDVHADELLDALEDISDPVTPTAAPPTPEGSATPKAAAPAEAVPTGRARGGARGGGRARGGDAGEYDAGGRGRRGRRGRGDAGRRGRRGGRGRAAVEAPPTPEAPDEVPEVPGPVGDPSSGTTSDVSSGEQGSDTD